MPFESGRSPKRPLVAACLAGVCLTALSGCTTLDSKTGLYARPTGGAPATDNVSSYTDALTCELKMAADRGLASPRVTVGRIADLTGKYDLQTGSQIGQGSTLFALTALGRAGFRVVERYDTTVSDIELAYAKAHTLSDSPELAGKAADNYRRIFEGQVAGSDYYIVGGVTELNSNISSNGVDQGVGALDVTSPKGTFRARNYVINVAIDLRLVNTRTQEVVDIVSYQKQVISREIKAGVFGFANGTIFDLSGGTSSMEPLHMAVRTLVERGIFEFGQTLYGIDARSCLPSSGRGGKGKGRS
jgi:curli production assembly/transport component CsgG/holdfast attachment protein HfaB